MALYLPNILEMIHCAIDETYLIIVFPNGETAPNDVGLSMVAYFFLILTRTVGCILHSLILNFIFWEGHKILRNLHLAFDWHYIGHK